tara:strand:+ start:1089 stop:1325 length:237 start_codon:yes stop_codon:yes gene_type:complete
VGRLKNKSELPPQEVLREILDSQTSDDRYNKLSPLYPIWKKSGMKMSYGTFVDKIRGMDESELHRRANKSSEGIERFM